MHGVGHAVVGVMGIKRFRFVLHKQGVTTFMQGRKDIGDKIIFIIMSGNAHVFRTKIGCKGMLGCHQHQCIRAQPPQFPADSVKTLPAAESGSNGKENHSESACHP